MKSWESTVKQEKRGKPMSEKDEDNAYPIEIGDHDSIINALKSISDIEIVNSLLMLESKGFKHLSEKLSKAIDLIMEVWDELEKKKVDYRIGV